MTRAAALGLALAACGSSRTWCDLDGLLDDAAPVGARDCGTGALDDDAEVMACLVDAFRDGNPFRGVTQASTPDQGLVARAWASDGVDVVVLLGVFDVCDDEACSGSVIRSTCADPAVELVGGRERIVCGAASACDEVLCGEGADPTCP